MITVVITGASGFVGRYLTNYLSSNELNIIPVSRQALPNMVQVRDYSQTPSGDVLIHLADEPDRCKVNHLGEQYMLDSAASIKILSQRFRQRIIYASSGVVYGDENESRCGVNTPVIGTDVYSKTKLLNEQVVLDAGGAVARLSNLFGLGMAATNVMSDIICQLPNDGPLRVRDDKPVRDFLSILDCAAAFGLLVQKNVHGIWNIGSGMGASIRTVAELLLSLANQEGRDIVASHPSSRCSINVLDITETTKALGWYPHDSLKESMKHAFSGSRHFEAQRRH